MTSTRDLLRLLGRRLPRTRGTIEVSGLTRPLQIHRDGWGVPHIRAADVQDGWFGVGFCHAQDRMFQLEMLLRAARGTLAALVGREGLRIDRLSRRLGIHHVSRAQIETQEEDVRLLLEAYARGVNAGIEHGAPRAHELVLLGARPSPWTAADALATLKVVGIGGLAENWAQEHARLMIGTLDGPDAVAALDPVYPSWLALICDFDALRRTSGVGGGSNNWALAGTRTASGRPLLANDPHLPPTVPGLFYLAHLSTPEWELIGATTPGCPGLAIGHNGHMAWGVTSGMADVADLSIEQVDSDGASVREGARFVPCEVREERIIVRGRRTPVLERVLVTPRGPIVSPALDAPGPALAMRCALLDPDHALRGPLMMHDARSPQAVQRTAASWPFPLNVVHAGVDGRIGWQFTGHIPRRPAGSGRTPAEGWRSNGGWDGWLASDDLPSVCDPARGYLATANNQPLPDGAKPYLGSDWMDGYRAQAIGEALGACEDWTVQGCLRLQRDQRSLPWRELRESVLALSRNDPPAHARRGLELFAAWDGKVSASSPAAAVFELLLAELCKRVVETRAPCSAAWALGKSVNPIAEHTILGLRRTSQLVRLLREQPNGWFDGGFEAELAHALADVVAQLERRRGPNAELWAWGRLRTLRFEHPLGTRRPLDRLFNLPPIAYGGDTNTICQASVDPLDPTGNPVFVPALRVVFDVGDWENSRFVLATGQSGNPVSPHYDDQHALWRRGEAIAIPSSARAVDAATVATLRLRPMKVA